MALTFVFWLFELTFGCLPVCYKHFTDEVLYTGDRIQQALCIGNARFRHSYSSLSIFPKKKIGVYSLISLLIGMLRCLSGPAIHILHYQGDQRQVLAVCDEREKKVELLSRQLPVRMTMLY